MTTTCNLCRSTVKDWDGDDPKCAFLSGEFDPSNWNCATMNKLRNLVYEGREPTPAGVDYQYCDDQKYATVKVSEVEGIGGAFALWMTWYKNRGRTEAVWLLFDDEQPRPPTESEVLAILRHYGEIPS